MFKDMKGSGRQIALIVAAIIAATFAFALLSKETPAETVLAVGASYIFLWVIVLVAGFSGALPRPAIVGSVIFNLSLLCCLILLEGATILRLVDYRIIFRTIEEEPWKNPTNRLDPELLHIHKGPTRITGVQHGGDISLYYNVPQQNTYAYDVTIDSRGFRNSEELQEAEIAVIGDSFIEAATVSEPEILTSVLQKELGRSVVNLGQLWYGPQQELHVLRRYAIGLKPKVVIWCFFGGNDLSDFKRYENALSNWEQISPSFHSLKQRSFSKNFLLFIHQMAGKPKERVPAEQGIVRQGASAGTQLYFYYPPVQLSVEYDDAYRSTLDTIVEAARITQEAGANFVLVYLPTKYEVYREITSFEPSSKISSWGESRLATTLGSDFEERASQAKYLDLTGPFQKAAQGSTLVYFTDDTHWTPYGNKVAASAISDLLRGSGMLTN